MADLNDYVATADKFKVDQPDTPVVVDQSAQAAFALDWASRQAERPQPAEPQQLRPAFSVSS